MNITSAEQDLIDMLTQYPFETDKQIADRLKKSRKTIGHQLSSLYEKFGIDGGVGANNKRAQLIMKLLTPNN